MVLIILTPQYIMQAINWRGLKQEGIEKNPFRHGFVYRFPESKDMPAIDFAGLENELGKEKERQLALYVHIPFCTGKCGFCHYYKEVPKPGQIESYLDALKQEITAYRKAINGSVRVQSVFFGGGTPTMLEAEQLGELLGFLGENFKWKKGTEVSVESSPETFGEEKLGLMLESGFNRLSIGAQDFNDKVLRKSLRCHSTGQALETVEKARHAGFENINMDFIYGLPGQSIESWHKTIETALGLGLESATVSQLRVHEGTPFYSMERNKFPGLVEMAEMYYAFVDGFIGQGHVQQFPYQLVKKGKEMMFLENQWDSKHFLGFGVSSCSFVGNWDYNNEMPLQGYVKRAKENGIAAATGKKLSRQEQMKRFVALGVKKSGLNRKNSGISKEEFRKRFGSGLEEEFGKEVEQLSGLGMLENTGKRVSLSRLGMFFHDEAARKFF